MVGEWNRKNPPDPRLGKLHAAIYRLLADSPEGLDIVQIRDLLPEGGDQEHLNRRLRDLRRYYQIDGHREGNRFIYELKGPKPANLVSDAGISGRDRAHVLHLAKGRCQMCGRSITDDGIKLQIDHKLPRNWGGSSEPENLWAICENCNNGKRDLFSSYEEEEVKEAAALDSVYERIGHLLLAHKGEPVHSEVIEFVANAVDRQEDWQKRLRELRYPPIGWKIETHRRKNKRGIVESSYTLVDGENLPADHKRLIKDWEQQTRAIRERR